MNFLQKLALPVVALATLTFATPVQAGWGYYHYHHHHHHGFAYGGHYYHHHHQVVIVTQ